MIAIHHQSKVVNFIIYCTVQYMVDNSLKSLSIKLTDTFLSFLSQATIIKLHILLSYTMIINLCQYKLLVTVISTTRFCPISMVNVMCTILPNEKKTD